MFEYGLANMASTKSETNQNETNLQSILFYFARVFLIFQLTTSLLGLGHYLDVTAALQVAHVIN